MIEKLTLIKTKVEKTFIEPKEITIPLGTPGMVVDSVSNLTGNITYLVEIDGFAYAYTEVEIEQN